MYSYFKSEALKVKHTFVGKLMFIAPVFAILISWFLLPKYFEVNCYNWWYSSILPGVVSLVCTLVVCKDTKMKNRAVLSLPINLKKVWIGKVFVCVAIITLSSLVLFLGSSILGAVLNYNLEIKIPIFTRFLAVLVLVVTFLWQIPLCLFLGNKIGMFFTIIINIGSYMILGILLATQNVLWIVPYAIPARLMCPILKILPNGLLAVEGSQTFKPELLSTSVILPGILVTLTLFIVLTLITAKWYGNQEAK